jgi:hypothetical protein
MHIYNQIWIRTTLLKHWTRTKEGNLTCWFVYKSYKGSRWAMGLNISVKKRTVTLPLGCQALHSSDNENLHFHPRYQNLYTRNLPCILTFCQWVLSGLGPPNALTHQPVTSGCTWSGPQQSNMFHPWYFHQAHPQ